MAWKLGEDSKVRTPTSTVLRSFSRSAFLASGLAAFSSAATALAMQCPHQPALLWILIPELCEDLIVQCGLVHAL